MFLPICACVPTDVRLSWRVAAFILESAAYADVNITGPFAADLLDVPITGPFAADFQVGFFSS